MKSLMLLLALGLVSTEKLDRTYLPPPGSKFSGGDPGDLQVPFEFPKESYTTTAPFPQGPKNKPSDTQLTTGFDRESGLTKPPGSNSLITAASSTTSPLDYSHNIYKLPTTTTSYAFTQTTTFPPPEGFETTVSPFSGFPDGNIGHQQPSFVHYPHGQAHTLNEQGGQHFAHPGRPVSTPTSNIPNFQFSIPGEIDGHPGFNQPQGFNQLQQNLSGLKVAPTYGTSIIPGLVTSSPYDQRYTQHSGVQPPDQQGTFPSSTIAPTYQTGFPSQFGNVQGPTTPSTFQQTQYPSQFPQPSTPYPYTQTKTNQYVDRFGNVQVPVTATPNQAEIQQSGQRPLFGGQPGPRLPNETQYGGDLESIRGVGPAYYKPNQFLPTPGLNGITFNGQPSQSQYEGSPRTLPPFSQTLVPGQGYPQGHLPGQQSSFSSAIVQPTPGSITPQAGQQNNIFGPQDTYPSGIFPDRLPSISQPGSQFSNIPSSNTLESTYPGQQNNIIPSNIPGTRQKYGSNEQTLLPFGESPTQPFSTQNPGIQNVYQPGSTAVPGSDRQVFPSSTQTPFPSYGTTASSNYPNFTPGYQPSSTPAYQGIYPSNIGSRPERPQAESDRNAVILNYKNELTPEGFSYSFDTSNGIHADENGTAIGGVKAEGSYSYIGDDGKVYNIVYTADENGFRPYGDHIPTPPPVPEAIQRVIEQAERDKEAGIIHDGSYDETKYGHKKYQGPRRRPQLKDKTFTNGVNIPDENENFDKSDAQILPAYTDKNKYDENNYTYNKNYMKQSSYPGNKKKPFDEVPSQKLSNTISEKDSYEPDSFSQEYMNQRPPGSKTGFRNKYIPERKGPVKQLSQGERFSLNKNKGKYNIFSPDIDEELQEEFLVGENDNLPEDIITTKIPSSQYSGIKSTQRPNESYRGLVSKTPQVFKYPIASGKIEKYYTDDIYTQGFDDTGRPTQPTKSPLRPYGTSFSDSDKADKINTETDEQGVTDVKYKQISQRRPIKPSKEIYDHQIGRQPLDEQQNKFYQQSFDDETGYYYTPPQNKFEQGPTTRFPARLSETARLSTENPPAKYDSKETRPTIRPFMTPNVYQKKDKSSEDISGEKYETNEPNTYSKTTLPQEDDDDETINNVPDYFDQDIELDIGDDEITATRVRPEKPESVYSTHRPSYSTQKSGVNRPNSKKTTTSTDQDNGLENKDKGKNPTYYVSEKNKGSSRKPSYVPSTTPMPSRQPTYDVTTRYPIQSSTSTLGNDYAQETDQPGIFSSTRPSQKSRNKPQGDSDVTMPIYSQHDSSSTRAPSTRPTSRPDYSDGTTITDTTAAARPSTIGNVFRKPSSKPGDFTTRLPSSTIPASITVQSRRPTAASYSQPSSTTYSPGSTVSYSGTNYPDKIISTTVTPGPGSRIPGQSFLTQNIPSTTYRPNYSIADITQPQSVNVDNFGRPVTGQPSQFIERTPGLTVFAARNQSQPGLARTDDKGSAIRPGFNVKLPGSVAADVFERPVNLPDQENQGIGSTARPEYTEFTQERSQAPGSNIVDAFGSPLTQSGQTFYPGQTVKGIGRPGVTATNQGTELNQPSYRKNVSEPTESRFSSTTPGPKPIEFGPSNIKTPAYLSPYPSSTERVVGEDFRGPKQPQRFDPETGYHY